MKLSDFSNIVAIVMISLFSIIFIQLNILRNYQFITLKYNRILDTASEDALYDCIERASNEIYLQMNYDELLKCYMENAFNGFGIRGNKNMESILQQSLPVIIIVDIDGIVICYNDRSLVNGETITIRKYTEKIPYVYTEETGVMYYFTLEDYVTIVDKDIQISGRQKDFHDMEYIVNDVEDYEKIKKQVVIHTIRDNFQKYINEYNDKFHVGKHYMVHFPYDNVEKWYRTVGNISIISFFQGKSIFDGDRLYTIWSISGSRLHKITK